MKKTIPNNPVMGIDIYQTRAHIVDEFGIKHGTMKICTESNGLKIPSASFIKELSENETAVDVVYALKAEGINSAASFHTEKARELENEHPIILRAGYDCILPEIFSGCAVIPSMFKCGDERVYGTVAAYVNSTALVERIVDHIATYKDRDITAEDFATKIFSWANEVYSDISLAAHAVIDGVDIVSIRGRLFPFMSLAVSSNFIEFPKY